MKNFRRFLMLFAPILVLVLAFIFIPQIRPDLSEYRELRKAKFQQPIEISKKTKTVLGKLDQNYIDGDFVVLDVGKIRLAIRNDQSRMNPVMKVFPHRSFLSGGLDIELLIDPPRNVKKPPPPTSTAGTSVVVSSAHGIVPPTVTPFIHELPGGTRVDIGGKMLRFENGKLTLGDKTVSTIEKPILIVLDDELNVEMIEDLDPDLMPKDRITP